MVVFRKVKGKLRKCLYGLNIGEDHANKLNIGLKYDKKYQDFIENVRAKENEIKSMAMSGDAYVI